MGKGPWLSEAEMQAMWEAIQRDHALSPREARRLAATCEEAWERLRPGLARLGPLVRWGEGQEVEAEEATRTSATLVLDLYPRVSEDPGRLLREALGARDPHVLAWAVRAAIGTGYPLPDRLVAVAARAAARDDVARDLLHGTLAAADRLDLLPEWARTDEAIARADMVQWLAYPTELGHPPFAIELGHVESQRVDGHDLRWFVFRFQEESVSSPWLAAVTGPWTPSMTRDGHDSDTFSSFTPWQDATPSGHVAAIRALLAASRRPPPSG